MLRKKNTPTRHCFCKCAQETENRRDATFSVGLVCVKSAEIFEEKGVVLCSLAEDDEDEGKE